MASDDSDIDDKPLISEDTTEIITAPYNHTDPIEIITVPASDEELDEPGDKPPGLSAAEVSEESEDEGVSGPERGEPEKGGSGSRSWRGSRPCGRC